MIEPHMRRQSLLLVAAVSLYFTTTAQQSHFLPKLSLERTYDVVNLNKTFKDTSPISKEKLRSSTKFIYAPLPKLKLTRVLYQQMGSDLSYLRMENWKIKFRPGCGTHPISFEFRD